MPGGLTSVRSERGSRSGELTNARQDLGSMPGELTSVRSEAGPRSGELTNAHQDLGSWPGELTNACQGGGTRDSTALDGRGIAGFGRIGWSGFCFAGFAKVEKDDSGQGFSGAS